VTKNVDTAPDGFYAVCAMGRGLVPCFFWAAWWSASGLAVSPAPDAHGVADRIEDAHASARAAIHAARGPRASVLRLDPMIAVEAARIARPRAEGYVAGGEWYGEDPRRHASSSRAPAPAPRTWPQVLELSLPCTAADVRRAYRRLALKRHPDRGGTDAEFNALTKAYDAALLELSETRA
jgi:hypothetical protein